ncbi:MAG: class II fructose-bisphosphate aldolase [Ruminococcus sp.]|nr:class II fructose-bisphosphate aldolase [Ruminococcus sp.]
MSLVTMSEVLKESIEKKYAVGAFDTMDRVFTEAILDAAEQKGVPVILMVMPMSVEGPEAERFMGYVVKRCRESSVPVALHLDHSPTYEHCVKAIHLGCTSVMFDGSSLPYEENVAITKKVIDVAHACGVTVEAEIGHVAGHEGNMLDGNVADESAFTTVEEAKRFYEDTGVDCLAVAIGTVHGVYKGTPHLDLERLQEIRDALPIPIVIHGGSGLVEKDYKGMVAHGANKINFFTAMSLEAAAAVRKLLAEKEKLGLQDITIVGQKAAEEVVAKHIEIFGTQPLSC